MNRYSLHNPRPPYFPMWIGDRVEITKPSEGSAPAGTRGTIIDYMGELGDWPTSKKNLLFLIRYDGESEDAFGIKAHPWNVKRLRKIDE